jgi:hypothetical protein
MNMGFGMGTAFYATVPVAGTGNVKVSILYAY